MIFNAVKNGNFNAFDTWDRRVVALDGVDHPIPVLGDIARCGNFTVTLTADLECDELQCNGSGRFATGTANLNVKATYRHTALNSAAGFVIAATTGTLHLTGDAYGGNFLNAIGITLTPVGGALEINGSVHAGNAPGAVALMNASLHPVVINNGNIVNSEQCSAITGSVIYNPGPDNYVQYPKQGGVVKLLLPIEKLIMTGTFSGEIIGEEGRLIGDAVITVE
jgi:hypothetical protein